MVDTNYEDGRSYISALSEVYDDTQTCDGRAKVSESPCHYALGPCVRDHLG